MKILEVLDQAQLDCVPDDFEGIIIIKGNVSLSRVWENASAVLWGNARAELWENARAVLWENARANAQGNSCIHAYSNSIIFAGKCASVHKMRGHAGSITGGVIIEQPGLKTAEDWCAYNGVVIKDGVATLFKAVRDDYKSAHDFLYTPGSTPECPDWDGGVAECRGGLHFCPSPGQALSFDDHATRFLACPVALVDIRSPNDSDRYPYKVKAARICGPIVEVDRFGEPLKEMGGKPV